MVCTVPSRSFGQKGKAVCMEHFAQRTRAPQAVVDYIRCKWGGPGKGRKLWLDGNTVFPTCQGPWGLHPLEHLTKDVPEAAVVCALRERAPVQEDWKICGRFVHGVCQELHDTHVAYTFELCTQT